MKAYYEQFWQDLASGLKPYDFKWRSKLLADNIVGGSTVLDLGCGEAQFSEVALNGGAGAVIGVDIAENAIKRGLQRNAELDLRLLAADGTLPLDDCSVDLVWASEVIEHVADTAQWLSEIRRVLKPSGRLLITTPAHQLVKRTLIALFRFESYYNPCGQHLRFYSADSLTELLTEFGFTVSVSKYRGGFPLVRETLAVTAVKDFSLWQAQ